MSSWQNLALSFECWSTSMCFSMLWDGWHSQQDYWL
jgi:hypothetical protein